MQVEGIAGGNREARAAPPAQPGRRLPRATTSTHPFHLLPALEHLLQLQCHLTFMHV